MNEAETARFRALIEARLAAIAEENALGVEGQAVVTLDQQAVGRLSRMDALQMQAMARAQQGRRDVESQRLRVALQRLAQGDYGFCDDCAEAIPTGRLELDLGATLCVSCAAG
ncbi:MAG: TraR/DksA C4-type zinc finger protein [Marinibacterium sp.]|nr:TraR/DksA C4-type zinc finger protein [Marinibacterium sp.]